MCLVRVVFLQPLNKLYNLIEIIYNSSIVWYIEAQARHFFECCVFAYKGTREAELRNSIYIYIPSKPPFKCTTFLFVATARHNK